MNYIVSMVNEVLNNFPLMVAVGSMFLAQTVKIFYYFYKEGKINFLHFFEAGGMPSAHSCMVTSLSTSIGLTYGWGSVVFAVAVIFSIVVMYDAMGVRRAASKQAYIVNKLVDDIYNDGNVEIEKLKEIIGHSPDEVIVGAVLGLFTAALSYMALSI